MYKVNTSHPVPTCEIVCPREAGIFKFRNRKLLKKEKAPPQKIMDSNTFTPVDWLFSACLPRQKIYTLPARYRIGSMIKNDNISINFPRR